MDAKVRRDRKKKCLYCHCSFTPNRYTYATQESCKSPACERAATAARQQRFRDQRKNDASAYRTHLEAEAVRARNNRLKTEALAGPRSFPGNISPADLMAVVVGQITALTGSQTSAECGEVVRTYKRKGRRLLGSVGGHSGVADCFL